MHPFRKAVESDDLEAVAAVGDLMHFDDDGKIDDFTGMVRPLSAAQALGEAMGAQFEQIAREAAEQ
ncbi:hypothetical protein GCM10010320_29080 [Streptomyces caelestis]|jgi:hypothetical protein|uniref:Uncharacterized protein n=1 Tax=Streptomyces caelestis TaxID=36816 RepID=A0A7W9LWX2_9ACTN|nr:hypothetical protein [Streptomyces caelestis]GGW46951.1 hypothetical protein GCM10010320_29080 [Streptomyces caelestis]